MPLSLSLYNWRSAEFTTFSYWHLAVQQTTQSPWTWVVRCKTYATYLTVRVSLWKALCSVLSCQVWIVGREKARERKPSCRLYIQHIIKTNYTCKYRANWGIGIPNAWIKYPIHLRTSCIFQRLILLGTVHFAVNGYSILNIRCQCFFSTDFVQ